MLRIREVLTNLFGSSTGKMTFPEYFHYVNSAGKMTARSIMGIQAVLCTAIETQEKINEQNSDNFKQIFDLLQKMIAEREKASLEAAKTALLDSYTPWICPRCGHQYKTQNRLKAHMDLLCEKRPRKNERKDKGGGKNVVK